MIQKKGAFELSASFVVITIISVTLLVLSITLLYQFMGGGENVSREIDEGANAALSQPTAEGAKVVMFPSSAQLRPGGEQIFSLNILNVGAPSQFFLEITISRENEKIGGAEEPLQREKWLVYSQEPFLLEANGKRQQKALIKVPSDAHKGTYLIKAKVFHKLVPSQETQYGSTQQFQLYVTEEGKQKKQETETGVMGEECSKDLSCDYYIVFVPIGNWQSQKLFEDEVTARASFLVDISPFKSKKTGIVALPLDFTEGCSLAHVNQESAHDHMEIKSCADKYADKLGISYERAIGLSSEYTGGKAFFNSKTVYASLGFGGSDRPGVVAHELGHTYSLCDEYEYQIYQTQNAFLRNSCQNQWPTQCTSATTSCLGNTPPFRDYNGPSLLGVCMRNTRYSVMGFSTGAECGYDATGGYQAIERGLS